MDTPSQSPRTDKLDFSLGGLVFASLALSIQLSPFVGRAWPALLFLAWGFFFFAGVCIAWRIWQSQAVSDGVSHAKLTLIAMILYLAGTLCNAAFVGVNFIAPASEPEASAQDSCPLEEGEEGPIEFQHI